MPDGQADLEFRKFLRFSTARNPSGVLRRDLMLLHAYVEDQEEGRICAAVRVTADEAEHDPRMPGDQWPLVLRMTPLLVVPLAAHGPTLTDIGLHAGAMQQLSHREVPPAQFRAAVRLIANNALPGTLGLRE